MKVKNNKGFTLAELLIVMAIVVVLAAVAVPTFGRQLETARETSDMEVVRNCYEEVLSIATLDSLDGTLDMKTGSGATGETVINYAGIDTTVTAEGEGTSKTYAYKVTLEDLDATPVITQGTAGWQFVNGYLFGVQVGGTDGISAATTKTLTYKFTFNNGVLKLSAVVGAAS